MSNFSFKFVPNILVVDIIVYILVVDIIVYTYLLFSEIESEYSIIFFFFFGLFRGVTCKK